MRSALAFVITAKAVHKAVVCAATGRPVVYPGPQRDALSLWAEAMRQVGYRIADLYDVEVLWQVKEIRR